MSIITTAQAVPSRLFAIYAALFESEHGESRERLESCATPPSLSSRGADEEGESSTTLFSNTLQEARRLGLVEEMDDKLRLTADARGSRKERGSEGQFRAYLQRTLFDSGRADETQQSGFMFALAWFLNLNPLNPIGFAEPPQNSLRDEIGSHASRTELTSLNRYQNFLYWARYLGFATIVGGRDAEDAASRRVFPDPTRAIEGALSDVFGSDTELPVEIFLSRLALIFPVFEKGSIRQEYDDLRRNPPPSEASHRLSITTSLALQRLEDRQKIMITSVADAPTRILNFGGREGRLSHISLKGAA